MPNLRTLAFTAVLVPLSLFAQPSPFAPARRSATLEQKKETPRSRTVAVDARLFTADQDALTLTLFDDVKVVADLTRFQSTKWGNVWSGKVRGGGTAIFVRSADVVSGLVDLGAGKRYRVQHAGKGVHRIRQIDKTTLFDEAPPFAPTVPRSWMADTDTDDCATDPSDEIQAMIVYTTEARDSIGGTAAVEAECVLAVEAANLAYENSEITQRLTLVYLGQVTYTESNDSETDLAALENPADTLMDDVHTTRDSVAADVVAMMGAEFETNNCGRANIMQSPDTGFSEEAFAVVRLDCAVDYFSYAHEMGHIMSARHDWPNDGADNSPYHYNHGYYNTAPSAGDAYRTIMGKGNDDCDAVGGCDRLQYFSNPNINEPVSGDPLGTEAEPEPADNHRTLNNTAYYVANFRCSSPNTDDVWMKDNWDDTGVEPNPTSLDMWRSPYIWVRNTQDSDLYKQHQHQDPISGTTNWVYVKMHNGASTSMSGTLELYYANADASLTWPTSWTLVDSIAVTGFSAYSTRVVEAEWIPPATGHYCMLARWVDTDDPMATAETADINANVRNNNNLAWRNLNIIDASGADEWASFRVSNTMSVPRRVKLLVRAPQAKNFLADGRVTIELLPAMLNIWNNGGQQGNGYVREGPALFHIGSEGASFHNLLLPANFVGQVRIRFGRKLTTPRTTWMVNTIVDEINGNGVFIRRLGGVSYEVHTEINFVEGETFQH